MKEYLFRTPKKRMFSFCWSGGTTAPRLLRFRLVCADSELELRGAFFAEKQEQLPLRIEVVHEAPATKSTTILRGLVDGQASVEAHALAVLKKGASGSRAHVEARALLRSEQARAKLEPYLEIDEDDVRVTHSASVKPLEEEEIFYLMSRGLPRVAAEKLLLESFFAPVRKAAKYDVRILNTGHNPLHRHNS